MLANRGSNYRKQIITDPCIVFSPIYLLHILKNTLQGCVDKRGVAKPPLYNLLPYYAF